MRLKPLNDTVIIEIDDDLVPVDTSQNVLDAIKSGLIVLPEKNMVMKVSNKGKVVDFGSSCIYPFTQGQEIIYDQFVDLPVWHEENGIRYRIIKEHYIRGVYE